MSAARFFLFGSRDIWFVVALPIFLDEVLEVADDLGMSEVVMERGVGRRGHATKVGNRLLGLDGELELDRLFHRGLELEEARWLPELDASDHVPLMARFRFSK